MFNFFEDAENSNVVFSKEKNRFARINPDNSVSVYAGVQGSQVELTHTFEGHDCEIRAVAFSTDPDCGVLVGVSDNKILVWDVINGSLISSLETAQEKAYFIASFMGEYFIHNEGKSLGF